MCFRIFHHNNTIVHPSKFPKYQQKKKEFNNLKTRETTELTQTPENLNKISIQCALKDSEIIKKASKGESLSNSSKSLEMSSRILRFDPSIQFENVSVDISSLESEKQSSSSSEYDNYSSESDSFSVDENESELMISEYIAQKTE